MGSIMKDFLLSVLRDKHTVTAEFRKASDQLAHLLCAETCSKLSDGKISVETPLGIASGVPVPQDLMVVPVMRAALAILPAFIDMLPNIPVGMVGIERDENTALARCYYTKFPATMPGRAVILDPMLATGGSACLVAGLLADMGYRPESIYFTGVVAAQEGFDRLAEVIPSSNITIAAIDPELNGSKFIVPGLGDYGDRYYGT